MTATLGSAFAQLLENAGVGRFEDESVGGTIYAEGMPQSPDDVVAVYTRPGPEPSAGHAYDDPSIQVIVRAANGLDAHAKAWEIYRALHGLGSVELPDGTWLVSCIAQHSGPALIGPDESGRREYSLNFRTEIRAPVTAHRS